MASFVAIPGGEGGVGMKRRGEGAKHGESAHSRQCGPGSIARFPHPAMHNFIHDPT